MQVVDPPQVAKRPSWPRAWIFVALGLFGGMLMGCICSVGIFLYEYAETDPRLSDRFAALKQALPAARVGGKGGQCTTQDPQPRRLLSGRASFAVVVLYRQLPSASTTVATLAAALERNSSVDCAVLLYDKRPHR